MKGQASLVSVVFSSLLELLVVTAAMLGFSQIKLGIYDRLFASHASTACQQIRIALSSAKWDSPFLVKISLPEGYRASGHSDVLKIVKGNREYNCTVGYDALFFGDFSSSFLVLPLGNQIVVEGVK